MRVRVRTIDRLARYLPADRSGTRAEVELPDGASLLDLVEKLDFPGDRAYLVTLNGRVVRLDRLRRTPLSEGDEVMLLNKPKVG